MKIRDSLYKKLRKKTHNMAQISQKHKKYRNLIITLQRRSKEIYFQNFFLTNQQNIKKTWKGIKDILAISKKKPPQLIISLIKVNNAQVTKTRQTRFVTFIQTLEKQLRKNTSI